ncbi:hypothetical protein IHE43_11730 [Flavobacterium sp. MDT1-60]|nr:hypothetical protein IHE43_11730 [Flavobacterium sp. MDT1-60]
MNQITLIAIVILFLFFGLRGKISGEKFDSEKWKTADLALEDNWSLRWDMMNSLRNNNNLIGMSKTEIITLLGKPDGSLTTGSTFKYYLGYSHTGINTGSLVLTFDNGIVSEISVWQG